MIDKLVIATSDMDFEALKRAFGETVTAKPTSNLYDFCQKVSSKTGKHLFTAYWAPRNPNMLPFRLEFNPSKLALKFYESLKWLDNGMDIGEATIQRIDHNADYEIPVSTAFESVRWKHKRNVKGYDSDNRFWESKGGELTGFYIGSKFEQIVIYNKGYELEGRKFKAVKGFKPSFVNLTRFEVRQLTKKVPFRLLKELPFLMTYNPFSSIEALELKRTDGRFESFHERNKIYGMQDSYINLNKQNNFKRDSAKHFRMSDLPQRLALIYRDNLGLYFQDLSILNKEVS
jgi:hypothetical protein